MDSLNRAIDQIARWKDSRKKERAEVLERLDGVIKECQAAGKVWQAYLDEPGAPGDHWTLVSWVGPIRAKQLHEINLRAKASVEEICRLAGPAAGRFVVLDDDVTEMAYRQLKPEETGIEAAKTAVKNLQGKMDYLRGLVQRVRSGRPGGTPSATKKSAPAKAKKKSSVKIKKKKSSPKKK